jgi:hypothetical protein
MKIQLCAAAGAALLLGACATETFPAKRPLRAESITALGETNVAVVTPNEGVETTWFMRDSSAAGAQYGLIGALVSAGVDAAMNAGPGGRAETAADELAQAAVVDKLNQSLQDKLTAIKAAGGAGAPGVTIGEVTTVQKILAPDPVDDAVEIRVTYLLSEDGRSLKVIAQATYQKTGVNYVTPYPFKSSVPKSETTGPLYRNTFTYESNHVPVPAISAEDKAQLAATIQKSYIDYWGKLPAHGDTDYNKMTREIAEAQDDKLSKSESLYFLAHEWTRDNGAVLQREIEQAHAFIAKYVLVDLNSTTVPSMTGADELVETLPDSRTVRIVGKGIEAGSYVSSPGGVSDFTTYGNAVAIAKVNQNKIKALNAEAKAKRSSR